jgi:hypothetical protein
VDSQNRANSPGGQGQGGGGNRRRRHRGGQASNRPAGGPNRQEGPQNRSQGPRHNERPGSAEQRNKSFQGSSRHRSRSGRVLTTNQVLVKYDNLLEQHLITRRKYFEYFNRVDERQLYKLEKNFFDSIEHLRRFEANLEPWQREALEKRKTERYKLDLTYSDNRGWNPEEIAKEGFAPEENEDPHFKESQREAFEAYKEDNEESEGSFEDYLNYKGQA